MTSEDFAADTHIVEHMKEYSASSFTLLTRFLVFTGSLRLRERNSSQATMKNSPTENSAMSSDSATELVSFNGGAGSILTTSENAGTVRLDARTAFFWPRSFREHHAEK